MANAQAAASQENHRVILFGGQGSTSVFSSATSSITEQDAKLYPACTILLSRYHAAFLEEMSSLDMKVIGLLGIDINLFRMPRDLLVPPVVLQKHGIIQATTIYVHQTLHYLAEVLGSGTNFTCFHSEIIEAAGFCSGMIPAAVVSASPELDDFIRLSIEGFRLAFWIAFRSVLYSMGFNQIDSRHTNASWSLVIIGLEQSEVENQLRCFYREREPSIRIAVITGVKTISLSGPEADLTEFKDFLGPEIISKFAHVHAWYHGGAQFENIVTLVCKDAEQRHILFPSASSLKKPIRSTFDGTTLETEGELIPWIARHLLVHQVDWIATSQEILKTINNVVEGAPGTIVELISFGPGSEHLIPKSNLNHPNISITDSSSFKVGRQPERQIQDGVAIVGMGVNLPKGTSIEELWKTIYSGLSAVSVIPESRFQLSNYYSTEDRMQSTRTMQARHGAFLDDPYCFDNDFFSISPREAKSMDPQQRILLHTTQAALEDAGYVGDATASFQRASMGCYIGVATGDYTDNLRNDIDVFYSPGNLRAFHSGRISYVYKLSGPSIVTDTACSSSAVSIYQACRALQTGECSAAIAGGVNVISSPDMYLGLARGHFLSPTGGCKPFDDMADGYCRAEGSCIFVLKRLSDAVAENDRIHGVIRDVVINQSGNAHSITHPHSETQVSLFKQLLHKSAVDPASVGVIEAHGTGTQAGDAREIESLIAVFGEHHSQHNPLFVSSIKGNIGHCEAASGAAGLAKLLLMFKRKKIPMQTGFRTLNPKLAGLEGSGIIIPRETVEWRHTGDAPRRAMLNNFGASGSNAALLLEELRTTSSLDKGTQRSAYILNISAKSRNALEQSIQQYKLQLNRNRNTCLSLKDICYTATARRQEYHYRVSFPCTSMEDLLSKLKMANGKSLMPSKNSQSIVFIFSGQGSTYRGMGEELMDTCSLYKDIIGEANEIVTSMGYPSFLGCFRTEQDNMEAPEVNHQIIASQCACVAMEYALARLLISWNIKPSYVAGHSLGEYAALCIAGSITLEETLRLVARRADLMVSNCAPQTSGMLACRTSQARAEAMINSNGQFSGLSVSCQNSIDDCVVGGKTEELELFATICKTLNIKTKILDVPYAFHSRYMDPILDALDHLGQSIKWKAPTIPVLSNVLGRLLKEGDLKGDYFCQHARSTVLFSDGIERMKHDGLIDDATTFLELGPHPVTLPLVRKTLELSSTHCTYVPALQRDRSSWISICSALSQLWLDNRSINWRNVFLDSGAKMIDLPGHPLIGKSFVVPFQESPAPSESKDGAVTLSRKSTGFALLPWLLISETTDDSFVFETSTSILGPLIIGHKVGGTAICPASVFHELVLEGARLFLNSASQDNFIFIVHDTAFLNSLIYSSEEEVKLVYVQISRRPNNPGNSADFIIKFQDSINRTETVCCTGIVSLRPMQFVSAHFLKEASMVKRRSKYILGVENANVNRFSKRILYNNIFARVVDYSAAYQTLNSFSVSESSLEGIGSFKLSPGSHINHYVSPPTFTDTLLHAAGFIANVLIGSEDICVCANVESYDIIYGKINYEDTFTIYCSLVEVRGAMLAEAFALDSTGEMVAVIRGMEFKKLRLSAFQRLLNLHVNDSQSKKFGYTLNDLLTPKLFSNPSTLVSPTTEGLFVNEGANISAMDPRSTSVIKHTLIRIVMEVSGFSEEELDYSRPVDELGIDSLMQIEIASKLARAFPECRLDHNTFADCETLQTLENKLSSVLFGMKNEPETSQPLRLVHNLVGKGSGLLVMSPPTSRINPAVLSISPGEKSALYLFHDGSGQVNMYKSLRYDRYAIFGFFDPFFGNRQHSFESLAQMAEYYISLLPESRDFSTIVLGGWSFGGVVAFEAARQILEKRGVRVKGLILIDSPYPINHKPLPKQVIDQILQPNLTSKILSLPESDVLHEEFQRNAALLGEYKPTELTGSKAFGVPTVMLQSMDTFDTVAECGVDYSWLSSQSARNDAVASWEGLIGEKFEVFSIPGNHFEAFSPNMVNETSQRILRSLDYFETRQTV
ncbi:polyketide beta-ketoacyl-synthase [Clarireedia jacksonii]